MNDLKQLRLEVYEANAKLIRKTIDMSEYESLIAKAYAKYRGEDQE